jgi:hypothetical protein
VRVQRGQEPVRVGRPAAPGTPGKLPGLQVGKTWLHAMPAVHAQVGWSHAALGREAID